MMELLVFKQKLKAFYGKYDRYVTFLVKFLLGFSTFFLMNENIGFMAKLNNPVVALVLGVVCAFLPYGAITFLAAVFMLAQISAVSMEITLILLVSLLMVAILYYAFQPGDSYLLLLVPILFSLRIPYVLPLLVGLSGSLVAVIPVSCGVFFYYALLYVKQNAGVLTNDASVELTQKYMQLIKILFSNQMMVVMIAMFAVSILVVFIIRNLAIDYAWMVAIVAGAVAQICVAFVGDFIFDVSLPIGQLLLGVTVAVVIAGIYDFFIFAVDYSRTEYLQYQDDDYYYYVKAVPKITVSEPDVKVQKINPKKGTRPQRDA